MLLDEPIEEARRQAEICNACRYCEGYCSVFPALHRSPLLLDADITQLANLCHNCRGCYYACQYTAPHEFDVNFPQALARVRNQSWEQFAWPAPFAHLFQKSGTAISAAVALGFSLMLLAAQLVGAQEGAGFYAVIAHQAMVAIFLPAFVFPLGIIGVGLVRYWKGVKGGELRLTDFAAATVMVANMRDLAAGHGDGCNFEDKDRFSHARRLAHQSILFGFLLSFAATASGTVMHYVFAAPAPYPLWSLPKLLGVPGGVLLAAGAIWMAVLKWRADRRPAAEQYWGGEMAFIILLAFVASSGLALYALGQTAAMPLLLSLHLGAVLALFVLTPYTKMAHGFYRFAALLHDAQQKRTSAKKG